MNKMKMLFFSQAAKMVLGRPGEGLGNDTGLLLNSKALAVMGSIAAFVQLSFRVDYLFW